jgi:hypothetical protein
MNHEYGPINTSMSLLQHITKTWLLIPYEQLYVQSHSYVKELTLEQKNTGENCPMYQLMFLSLHYVTTRIIHWCIFQRYTNFLELSIEHTAYTDERSPYTGHQGPKGGVEV